MAEQLSLLPGGGTSKGSLRDGSGELTPSGNWKRLSLPLPIVHSSQTFSSLTVQGGELQSLDTTGAHFLIREVKKLLALDAELQLTGFSKDHERIFRLVWEAERERKPSSTPPSRSFLVQVGSATYDTGKTLYSLLSFFGEILVEFGHSIRSPRSIRGRELFVQIEQTLKGTPVVALVTFLIGVVVAYLFSLQIEKYGASIFLVDAVAIAMCRELAPLLVAVVMAGRTASAYTAQIGSMKINEELDAMKILGLSPLKVLVLPRVLALMIVLPLLVFVGDLVGIYGGLLIAQASLDITPPTFLARLQTVLPVRSFLVGLGKAPVFALVIALIGCQMGLSVENNSRSLGLKTTATVVQAIVAVIILDAIFAIIFQRLRW